MATGIQPLYVFTTPEYYSFQVPAITGQSIVTVSFALIGSGGIAAPCGNGPQLMSGGGGGVFIGAVDLPINTTIYYKIAPQATGGGLIGTYITLIPTTGELLPPYNEPYTIGGANGSGFGPNFVNCGVGGGVGWAPPSLASPQLQSPTGTVYPITILYSGNGTNGDSVTPGQGGAPVWLPSPQWIYTPALSNPPLGGIGQGYSGSTPTPNFPGNGMIIVSFSFPGYSFPLYYSNPLNYSYPFFYTTGQNSTLTVPNIYGNNQNVSVIFLLQGAGGNGDETPTLICSYDDGQGDLLPGLTYFCGGSGGVLKASVPLSPGTVLYINVSANGTTSNSFISLTQPLNASIPDDGLYGQQYASVFAACGGSVTTIPYISGTNGAGGGIYVGSMVPGINLQNVSTGASYPGTVTNYSNGFTGSNSCSAPVGNDFSPTSAKWITPSNYIGYLNNDVNTSTLITTTGQGGEGVANGTWPQGYGTDGLVVIGFGVDIPWAVNEYGNDRDRPALPCFPEGTRILTPLGYKPVETIQDGYLVTTAANRQVPVKVYKRIISSADKITAPYLIPKNSLGSFPISDLRLSPLHAFRLQPDLWQIPEYVAKQNKQIKQYGIGMPVTYYHLECPNYFQDNLLVDCSVVESYGKNQVDSTVPTYTFIPGRKGFVRTAKPKNTLHHRFTQ